MRPSTACVACRKRRRKCVWSAPKEACTYCQTRRIPCSFTEKDTRDTSPSQSPSVSLVPVSVSDVSTTSVQSAGTILPPQHVCFEVADYYFRYIHDIQLSLFHRPTFMADLAVNAVPEVLLMAILGLAARFSNNDFFAGTDPRSRGRPYVQVAEKLLNLTDVSTTTIRACILLGACCGSEGKAAPESIYYTIACRMGSLLDVPNTHALSQLDRELNIRLWWALTMSDVWIANGVQLPRLLIPKDSIPYPAEEDSFLALRREMVAGLSPDMRSGDNFGTSLLAQMIKLNAIFVEISDMNRAAANHPSSFTFDNTVEWLGKKLDSWYANLPPRLQDTQENMRLHAETGQGGTFVAVYLGYYHFGQLLFYQYLHQNIQAGSEMSTKTSYYADKCAAYSTALCDITFRAMATPGAEVLYSMVGHVLVIASTVQLHTLLFSSDDLQVRNARRRLERNFEILSRLQILWPYDHSFERFQEFHRACQRSKESSFRMDKWMLKFLFQNATPVHEKPGDGEGEVDQMWSIEGLGFSPYDPLT